MATLLQLRRIAALLYGPQLERDGDVAMSREGSLSATSTAGVPPQQQQQYDGRARTAASIVVEEGEERTGR